MLAGVLALLTCASAVSARPRPDTSMAIEWMAPPECPTREWLLAEVSRLLGRPPDERVPPAMRVQGEVTHVQGAPYRVFLRTEAADGTGERTLEDPACIRVAEAAAVVIALAIDPGAVVQTENRARGAQPPSVPQRAARFAAAPLIAADFGTLPRPRLGLGLLAALLAGRTVRAEVAATSWLPEDIPAGGGVPGGAHVRMLFLGNMRACAAGAEREMDVGGCLGIEAGALEAIGFGISRPATTVGLWLAATIGPTLWWNVTDYLSLRVGGEAALAPVVPEFTVRAQTVASRADLYVYRPPWIVGRAAMALELRY
jgi:hypothetical protein